ncbi:MAG: acyloxyacyl hydrolase [Bacteroidetes bacterium]|nr:acyloxyacyl hydrolase [Bacteroidota bacterium]
MKRPAVLGLVLGCISLAYGQHNWGFRTLPGFLVPHHEDMQAMMAHTTAFELTREWRLDSSGILFKRHRNPFVGLGLNYMDLGNSINGKAFTFFACYDLGLLGTQKWSLRGRLGVGTGYLTKMYSQANPMNRAIGSHFNGFMQVLGYMQYQPSKRLAFQLGLGLSHHSNGNFSQPNLGVNEPSLFVGCKLSDYARKISNPDLGTTRVHTVQWQLGFRLGLRQISVDDEMNFTIAIADLMIQYPQNPVRRWRLGICYYYDRTYQYTKFQPMPGARLDRASEIAISGGQEYRIGRVGFTGDLGVYVYRPDRTKRAYYEALGLRYYVNDHLVVMNRLKAHLTSADFFEWGICYSINGRRGVNPGFGKGLRWLGSPFRRKPPHLNF